MSEIKRLMGGIISKEDILAFNKKAEELHAHYHDGELEISSHFGGHPAQLSKKFFQPYFLRRRADPLHEMYLDYQEGISAHDYALKKARTRKSTNLPIIKDLVDAFYRPDLPRLLEEKGVLAKSIPKGSDELESKLHVVMMYHMPRAPLFKELLESNVFRIISNEIMGPMDLYIKSNVKAAMVVIDKYPDSIWSKSYRNLYRVLFIGTICALLVDFLENSTIKNEKAKELDREKSSSDALKATLRTLENLSLQISTSEKGSGLLGDCSAMKPLVDAKLIEVRDSLALSEDRLLKTKLLLDELDDYFATRKFVESLLLAFKGACIDFRNIRPIAEEIVRALIQSHIGIHYVADAKKSINEALRMKASKLTLDEDPMFDFYVSYS